MRAVDRELAVAAAISTMHTTWLSLGEVGFDTEIVCFLFLCRFVHSMESYSIPLIHIFQLEDFYDVLRTLVEQVIKPEPGGHTLNASLLLEAFTKPEGKPLSIIGSFHRHTSFTISPPPSVQCHRLLCADAHLCGAPEEPGRVRCVRGPSRNTGIDARSGFLQSVRGRDGEGGRYVFDPRGSLE